MSAQRSRSLRSTRRRCVLLVAVLSAAWACSDVTTSLIDPVGAAASARDDASTTRDARVEGGAPNSASTACGGRPCACNDGMDNDGDELTDGLDPECTGPLDDDESSFGTGHPRSALGCQDCFWDGNDDGSDDGCSVPLSCTLVDASALTPDPACGACGASPVCAERCRPLAPNGCDCFGCCEVTRKDGSTVDVVLADACSVKAVDDAQACPRCTPDLSCRNECGTCELCLGRKRKNLPQSCRGKPTDTEPTPSCDEGQQPCSETEPCPDPDLYYCRLGCCIVSVF